MDGQTENLPILQDLVSYQVCCPASPQENQGRYSRAREPLTILCLWATCWAVFGSNYNLGKKNKSLSEKVWKMGEKYFFVYEIHQISEA